MIICIVSIDSLFPQKQRLLFKNVDYLFFGVTKVGLCRYPLILNGDLVIYLSSLHLVMNRADVLLLAVDHH